MELRINRIEGEELILSVDGDSQFPLRCFSCICPKRRLLLVVEMARILVCLLQMHLYKTHSKNREQQDLLRRKQMPCRAGYQNPRVVAKKASRSSSWFVIYLGCFWYFYYVRWPGEHFGRILRSTFAFPPIVAWSPWTDLSLVWTWLEL